METANKFSDIDKAAKKAGFLGIWDQCEITLHGEAIVYDFRENLLGKDRLQPKEIISIEGMKVVDENTYLRAVGIRPDKKNWYFEKKWLGPKSFPVKFTISKKESEEEMWKRCQEKADFEWMCGGYDD